MCMDVLPAMYVYALCACGACRRQKRALDPLELKLETAISFYAGVWAGSWIQELSKNKGSYLQGHSPAQQGAIVFKYWRAYEACTTMPWCVHLFLQKMKQKNETKTCFNIHFPEPVCAVYKIEKSWREIPLGGMPVTAQ